ncbi:hypothetical protein ABH926_006601 [Catenulispora sp. GP43]
MDVSAPSPHTERAPGAGRGRLDLHELEVPEVALLPFAAGSFQRIGPLSLADFPHRHTFYEIVLVTAGRGLHVVDSQPWPITPPHFGVIVPGQVHHWQDATGVEGSVLLFNEDFLVGHPEDVPVLRALHTLTFQIEHLIERHHRPIRRTAVDPLEVARHLLLPPGVDLGAGHRGERGAEVLGLQVADQQPVRPQEQRVVPPTGRAQRRQHVRPHRLVACPVFLSQFGLHLQQETDALHAVLPPYVTEIPASCM